MVLPIFCWHTLAAVLAKRKARMSAKRPDGHAERELVCPVCLDGIRAGDRVRGRGDNFIHESCDHYTRVWLRPTMAGSRSVWGTVRSPRRHSLSRRLGGRRTQDGCPMSRLQPLHPAGRSFCSFSCAIASRAAAGDAARERGDGQAAMRRSQRNRARGTRPRAVSRAAGERERAPRAARARPPRAPARSRDGCGCSSSPQ